MAARIKKGDTIIVLAGKDKGKRGQISRVFPKDNKVLVDGINTVITNKKQTKESAGGKISKSAPMHISNVSIIDPKKDEPTRIGFIFKDGKKVRIAKKSGEVLDG